MDTIISWALFILILTFIIFTVISILLHRIYPNSEEMQPEDLQTKQRRWIGLFVLVALICIMTMTGINSFNALMG